MKQREKKCILPTDRLSAYQRAKSDFLLGGPNSKTNAAVPKRILQIHFD
jgi:hypothetical protein